MAPGNPEDAHLNNLSSEAELLLSVNNNQEAWAIALTSQYGPSAALGLRKPTFTSKVGDYVSKEG